MGIIPTFVQSTFGAKTVLGCVIQGRRFALPLAITFRAVGA